MNKSTLLLLSASTVLLASCGWGDSDGSGSPAPPVAPPTSPTASVPASASGSIAGMVSYLMALTAVKNDNTDEPADVSAFAPPVSNTTEPDPLTTLQ